MKTEEDIKSMIADIEVSFFEASKELGEYERGYINSLKWVIGDMNYK